MIHATARDTFVRPTIPGGEAWAAPDGGRTRAGAFRFERRESRVFKSGFACKLVQEAGARASGATEGAGAEGRWWMASAKKSGGSPGKPASPAKAKAAAKPAAKSKGTPAPAESGGGAATMVKSKASKASAAKSKAKGKGGKKGC